MYGLPEQHLRLTLLTSASVLALMKATPSIVLTAGVGLPLSDEDRVDALLGLGQGDPNAVDDLILDAAFK